MPISLYALIESRPSHPNMGQPFYVGIGNKVRPRAHIRDARKPAGCRNRLLNLAIRGHFDLGLEPEIRIIFLFETRAQADAAEREMIARLGRLGRDNGGILCNVARGGDGPDSTLMSDPEIVAKIGAASRAMWAEPGARTAHGERIKALYEGNPEARARHGSRMKAALATPEVRQKHLAELQRINTAFTTDDRRAAEAKRTPDSRARSLAALTASRTDPEIQARRRENSREPQKNSWADPEIRARRIAAMKGKKKTMSEAAVAARQANSRVPRSEEALAAQRAAAERNWADPAFRAERSEERLASWQDPEKRARMLAGRSDGIAKSWENPETRERRIAAIKASSGKREGHDPSDQPMEVLPTKLICG